MIFHSQCIDQKTDICFSCIGIDEQDTTDEPISLITCPSNRDEAKFRPLSKFEWNYRKSATDTTSQWAQTYVWQLYTSSKKTQSVEQNKVMLLNPSIVTNNLDSHSKTETPNEKKNVNQRERTKNPRARIKKRKNS